MLPLIQVNVDVRQSCTSGNCIDLYTISVVPYDDDDSIKDIVGVSQVVERTKCSNFEDHLQREHAGEDDVADLQNIS